MATSTPNFALRKPDVNDHPEVVLDLADNYDKIDAHTHSGTYVPVQSATEPLIMFDTAGTYTDRHAVITINRNVPTPTDFRFAQHIISQGKGDNATFIGVGGLFMSARDRTDVTALNKGVLYGGQAVIVPIVDRNNVPFDDATGFSIENQGSGKGTDGLYIGRNRSDLGSNPTGVDWGNTIQNDSWSDNFIRSIGHHTIGLSLSGATISTAAIRLGNAQKISWIAADLSTLTDILQLDASNVLQIYGGKLRVFATGELAMPNDKPIQMLNGAASSYLDVLRLSSANNLSLLGGKLLVLTTGEIAVPNNIPLQSRNAANSAYNDLVKLDSTDTMLVYGGNVRVFSTGEVAIKNDKAIQGRNNANSAYLDLLSVTTGDSLSLRGGAVLLSAAGLLTLIDGGNLAVGTSTGTKIGTATTQKLGFFNATPVVQQTGASDVLASLVTLGLRAASSNPPLDLGSGALTAGAATLNSLTAPSANGWTGEPVGRESRYIMPAGTLLTSLDPTLAVISASLGLLTSGTPRLVRGGFAVPTKVTNFNFVTGTQAAVTPTHWWPVIVDTSGVVLAVGADQLTAPIAANTVIPVAFSAPTVIPAGPFYYGIMVAAGTVPTLAGLGGLYNAVTTGFPIRGSNSTTTGQTTPPALAGTVGAPTSESASRPWFWLT